MRSPISSAKLNAGALVLSVLAIAMPAAAQTPPQSQPTIEKLLEQGWEVAGYISAWENRSNILFRHKDKTYLVQCSVLIDALRSPRLVTYCYELH